MTDPRQPDAEPDVEPAESPSGSISLGAPHVPKGMEFTDPLSPHLYAWLNDLAKATRAIRVYAENNEMFQKFVDRAHAGLTELFEQVAEVNLSIREDRILFGGDAVHINADREEGIPFTFYRNAFRRLTLVRGMSRQELIDLMRAITTDYSTGIDFAGEDLVTALWRLALPHLRYLTIDAITTGRGAAAGEKDPEVERIQGSIEDIVAAIYRNDAADDDIVAGVSITKEDLDALKEIRQESVEDLEMLDRVTERAIADVAAPHLINLRREVSGETHDRLVRRVMGIFLHILFREQSARESTGTIQIIQQLFESMVFDGRFEEARELVDRLRVSANQSDDLREMHICQHLLKMFASEARVLPVLEAFNDEYKSSSVGDKVRFLRSLGSGIAPILLSSLERLNTPAHRRLLCGLIAEFGVPEPIVLMRAADQAKWFVVRDILTLAQHHPAERVSALIAHAIRHEHPKVRQQAVGMLRGYARGLADRVLSERLFDDEIDVRLTAARVAAARRSTTCRGALEQILAQEDFVDREPRELRGLMTAYAAIFGEEAVPVLDKILNPGFFARLKSADAQIAAALALGTIGGPSATAALQRGARTLSSKVRDACKRAIAQELRRGESRDDMLSGRGLKIPDATTTNPDQPLPTRDAGESQDSTPPKGNSADLDFTIGNTADVQDMLEGAPAFTLDLPSSDSVGAPVSAHNRVRPVLPRVDPANPIREEVPRNLPRVLTEDVSTAPGLEVRPTDPQANEWIVQDRLPVSSNQMVAAAPSEPVGEPVIDLEPPGGSPPPALPPEGGDRDAYDAIEQELMAYLGADVFREDTPPMTPAAADTPPMTPVAADTPPVTPVAADAPPITPVVPVPVDPVPEVEAAEPEAAQKPRFGGAAASDAWTRQDPGPDSLPEWGQPSGASGDVDQLEQEDLLFEEPRDYRAPKVMYPSEERTEQVPASAFRVRPPLPDADTEVAVRRPADPADGASSEARTRPVATPVVPPDASTDVATSPAARPAASDPQVPIDDLTLDDGESGGSR